MNERSHSPYWIVIALTAFFAFIFGLEAADASANVPAWMQAIGGITAVAVAVGIGRTTNRQTVTLWQRQQARDEYMRRLRSRPEAHQLDRDITALIGTLERRLDTLAKLTPGDPSYDSSLQRSGSPLFNGGLATTQAATATLMLPEPAPHVLKADEQLSAARTTLQFLHIDLGQGGYATPNPIDTMSDDDWAAYANGLHDQFSKSLSELKAAKTKLAVYRDLDKTTDEMTE